jgi:uncharacterized protein (DUF305 family)
MPSSAQPDFPRFLLFPVTALVIGLAVTGGAIAQSGGGTMPMQHEHMSGAAGKPSHDHHGTTSTNPVISAYQAVNDKMHRAMMITFTGDADRDFVEGMIPHHQGAIDMAEVVIQYGKDPEIRKLAEEIIIAQKQEIALMKTWLAKASR